VEQRLLRIFQREVERQCRFGIIADEELAQALGTNDMDRIWYSIQALLVAAGNVSKLLWPPSPRLAQRGESLRRSLSVNDDSPLEPRLFRNHFEHFDERLEEWAKSSQRRNLVDANTIPPGMIAGIAKEDFLRNFDPTEYSVTFRGDVYPLRPVVLALKQLWHVAATEADGPLSGFGLATQ
jgi:hypothetical protein